MNLRLMAPLLAAVAIAGCHDDHNDNSGSTPPPVSMDYSTFVQALIEHQSCDSGIPADLNSIDFTFAADQDTASTIDVSTITPACTS